jgi:hypothetical protein
MLMQTHAESVANMHRQNKDVKPGSIQAKAELLRSSSKDTGSALSLVKPDDGVLSQPSTPGQEIFSPGFNSELGSARSRADSEFSDLNSPQVQDLSPSPKLSQRIGAETTLRLFDKVIDFLDSNPDRVTSLWIGEYVDVEGHGKLLKHFMGTNPFNDQPPFNSSSVTNGGRTTFAIMDALLDMKGVQVDPRDAESTLASLRGTALLGRTDSLGEMNGSKLLEGVPPQSPRMLTLNPSPNARDGHPATSPASTGAFDELDAMEREIASLNDSSPAADTAMSTELAQLKEQLEQQAKVHAEELAAAQAEAAAARKAADEAGAKAAAASAEIVEVSVDASSSRSRMQQYEREQQHARDEQAALDASLRALEAELAKVKQERNTARAEAEQAQTQAKAAAKTAQAEAAAAAAVAADLASVAQGQGIQAAQVQEVSARHQQELAALRAERDELLQKVEQQDSEVQRAREASAEHAQRLREQAAEHRAAEAARSLEHSKLKADMAERAEVLASMAAAAAVNVDGIDETIRLQRRVQVLEEQLATGRQAAVSAHAANTSMIQIELERIEAENRGLQDELAIQQQRRVKQSTEHAELLAENGKLHAQLRRQASAQQTTMSELQELRSTYDDLINVTQNMSSSAVPNEVLELAAEGGIVVDSKRNSVAAGGFDTVRSRAQAVQHQVEALEREMRDLIISSPFSQVGSVSPVPHLSATRSTSRGSTLANSSWKSSSFSGSNAPGSPTSLAEGLTTSPSASPERSASPFELGAFLRQHELDHYEDALRQLGAANMDALRSTSLSDLNDLGMTTVEKLRFRKSCKSSS